MRNGLMKRIVTIVLAFSIAFTTPTSSKAVLPELIVGGSALLQIGSIVVSSLPQLVAVGTGVITLLKQGEEIADTVKRIFGIKPSPDVPTEPKKVDVAKAAPSQGSATRIQSLSFSEKPAPQTMSESFAAEKPENENPEATTADVKVLVDSVVETFYQRMGLEDAMRALPEASPERESLQAGYDDLEASFQGSLSKLTNTIVDAAAAGEVQKVQDFVDHVAGLEAAGQVAIAPVFAIVLEQGRRFQGLHGEEGDSAKAFTLLEEAYQSLGG